MGFYQHGFSNWTPSGGGFSFVNDSSSPHLSGYFDCPTSGTTQSILYTGPLTDAPSSMPSGATIVGLQVLAEVWTTVYGGSTTSAPNTAKDTTVELQKNGVLLTGYNVGANAYLPSVVEPPYTIQYWGTPTSLYGTTWGQSDFENANTGVYFQFTVTAACRINLSNIVLRAWTPAVSTGNIDPKVRYWPGYSYQYQG